MSVLLRSGNEKSLNAAFKNFFPSKNLIFHFIFDKKNSSFSSGLKSFDFKATFCDQVKKNFSNANEMTSVALVVLVARIINNPSPFQT